MDRPPKILVSPLDWGLGHATRCIPIIKMLLDRGFEVILAADGRSAALLRGEFPGLEIIALEGYGIRYPRNPGMATSMIRQMPKILRSISREHKFLEHLIDDGRIDAVVSDNRFGLWSERVPCIYITHQLMIKAPGILSFTEPMLHRLHARYIKKFKECWIPDFEGKDNLSGDLAHRIECPVPSYFIGPQSRFGPAGTRPALKYELMFIISGPEPQRSIFEKIIKRSMAGRQEKAIVITGKPELKEEVGTDEHIEIFPHMETGQMQEALLSSEIIISRPGYTTIMDMAMLGCKSVFVPTPGQTEQEYLAEYHAGKKNYHSIRQKDFQLDGLREAAASFSGLNLNNDNSVLAERIDQLAMLLEKKR